LTVTAAADVHRGEGKGGTTRTGADTDSFRRVWFLPIWYSCAFMDEPYA